MKNKYKCVLCPETFWNKGLAIKHFVQKHFENMFEESYSEKEKIECVK